MKNDSNSFACRLGESGTTPIDSLPKDAIFINVRVTPIEDLPQIIPLPQEKRIITEHVDFSHE